MLAGLLAQLAKRPALLVELHAIAAVTLEQALDSVEQIRPYRLRTHVAAPDAPGDGVHQEQRQRGDDQKAREVVDFLRPDLDEEEVGPACREIDQHRLIGRVRAAVPADEGQEVVDAQGERHHRPFDVAEGARDLLRVDLLAGGVELDLLALLACVRCGHLSTCVSRFRGGPSWSR